MVNISLLRGIEAGGIASRGSGQRHNWPGRYSNGIKAPSIA
jgi:hypothetical protein